MRKKLLAVAVAILAVVLVGIIIADFLDSKNTSAYFIAMNTTVSYNITGSGSDDTAEKIKSEILRLDSALLSRTNPSAEIYKVNSGALTVSDELASMLKTMKEIEDDSDGAVCMSLGSLTDLWGIGTENAKLPAQTEIDSVLKTAHGWSIEGNTVYLPTGAKLDMGAVGKGIACDYAYKTLCETDCSEAVIAVGGSILLYAKDAESTFSVGIRDPLGQANDYCAVIEITPGCVSTSGNYERYFDAENGKRYHHIFDPSTGYPAENELMSVTVIAQSGAVSDALSTACFVLGIEKSLPLLEKYGADAVFITKSNEIIAVCDSRDDGFITVTNDNYTLGEAK